MHYVVCVCSARAINVKIRIIYLKRLQLEMELFIFGDAGFSYIQIPSTRIVLALHFDFSNNCEYKSELKVNRV